MVSLQRQHTKQAVSFLNIHTKIYLFMQLLMLQNLLRRNLYKYHYQDIPFKNLSTKMKNQII
jgi:hypothetical protein